ncbi:MAG: hypothetical protein A3F67_00605 [Verrucomicrobia bacterium RIFCSPHIGHO2_12_FULL_41_10]|nr:MAG: hypothetical protein A3F67_00605 [Verrucomicrobia bacterium RIFCSPHIGHO2_12_FULL_41_10]HLB34180.1 hypothetical protein [Chthoniobacterales bacterium]
MLTAHSIDHELKVIWHFDDGVSTDLAEFEKLTAIDKVTLLQDAFYYMIGEKKVPLLEWRSFLSSLQILLDNKVKLHFICTSKKIYQWLNMLGFSLLGEVMCDPTFVPPENNLHESSGKAPIPQPREVGVMMF